jgi:hypothetical protein
MVIVSSLGLVLYTVVLPVCVIVAIRSRWAREIYTYNFLAYDHLFGFITSQYSASFFSWEAINCFRKMALIAIPIVVTQSPIVQSLANIVLFLVYAMIIIGMKPMASSFLNTIEVLNSFNIIVSSFAAMLFTVQYENTHVLQGDSRDFVGYFLIVFISSMFLVSIRIIYIEAVKLFALHKNLYLSKWLCVVLARTGGSILLDKYLPISLLFFNKTSRKAIQDEVDASDVNRKEVISSVSKNWFSTNMVASFFGYFVLAWTRITLRLKEWQRATTYEVQDDLVDKTLAEPDYEFFVWMHKLLQRVAAWKPHEKELRHSTFWQLPKQFTVSYGESDPPIAICDSLLRTSRAISDILNEDHKNLLLAFLLQDGVINIRANLDDGKCNHYQERMRAMVKTFKKQISNHVQASETFRNETETRVRAESCRPLRQRLYGARQSENVKVLRCISSTTLPQYRQLAQKYRQLAQLETDKRFADDRSPPEAASPNQRSSTDSRRGSQSSAFDEIGNPLTANNERVSHQAQLRHSKRRAPLDSAESATSSADGEGLQEIIIEGLNDAHVRKSSVMHRAALEQDTVSSPAEPSVSKRLTTTQSAGAVDPKKLTQARPDARRKMLIPAASSTAPPAAAGVFSLSKTAAHSSPQPQQPLAPEPNLARRSSFLHLYDLHHRKTLASSPDSEGIELGIVQASPSPSPTSPTAAAARIPFKVENKNPNNPLNSMNSKTRTAIQAPPHSRLTSMENLPTQPSVLNLSTGHTSNGASIREGRRSSPPLWPADGRQRVERFKDPAAAAADHDDSFSSLGGRASTMSVAHPSRRSALSAQGEGESDIQRQQKQRHPNEQLPRTPATTLAATAAGTHKPPADEELRQVHPRSQQLPKSKPSPFAVGLRASRSRTLKPPADDGLPPPPPPPPRVDRTKSIRP